MKYKYDDKKETISILGLNNHDIYDYFESKNFFFPKEIITRYFLSLKTKPFVILTGISGTGKTKIAQIFADYMCQDDSSEEKEKRIAFISVRPDWMDNKGLLGFFNILDEKYYATPFLKLVLNAKKNPEKPFFVILDEMNLAKVEQYFSDFLSVMESRTADNTEGERVFLHSLKNVSTDDGLDIPKEINIPPNIFFTGTVNIDETTYMFSPKVLDRSNVIEFNDVNLDQYKSGVASEDRLLLINQDVRDDLLSAEQEPFCSKNDFRGLENIIGNGKNSIEELLNRLKKYNMHFGYRVVNEISRFICLSKGLVEKFNLNESIDIQLLQKVLPKFHGTQGKLEEPLSDILCFCYGEEYHKDGTIDEKIKKAIEFDPQSRFPRSAQKVARMISNAKTQGYTSFIE